MKRWWSKSRRRARAAFARTPTPTSPCCCDGVAVTALKWLTSAPIALLLAILSARSFNYLGAYLSRWGARAVVLAAIAAVLLRRPVPGLAAVRAFARRF